MYHRTMWTPFNPIKLILFLMNYYSFLRSNNLLIWDNLSCVRKEPYGIIHFNDIATFAVNMSSTIYSSFGIYIYK